MSVRILAMQNLCHSGQFDRKMMLPGIKTRYLNDVTCYGIWAALACTKPAALDGWNRCEEKRRGLVVASTCADFSSRKEADALIRREGVSGLNSISAPNVSANIMAAHIAIHVKAHAFSHTFVSPGLGALEGVVFGLQSLHARQADAVLVLSAEPGVSTSEKPMQRSLHQDVPVSAAVALLLGRAPDQGTNRPVIQERFWGMCPPTGHALQTCWGRFLAQEGRRLAGQPDEGSVAVLCSATQPEQELVEDWVQELTPYGFPEDRLRIHPVGSNGSNEFLMGMVAQIERGASLIIAAAGRRRMAFSLNN